MQTLAPERGSRPSTLLHSYREKSANGILCRHARNIFYLSYELFIRHGVYVCKHSTKINVCYFEFKLCLHIAIHDGVLVERCQPHNTTQIAEQIVFLHCAENAPRYFELDSFMLDFV